MSPDPARSNEEVIRASYAAFGRRDIDAAMALFAPDIEWTHPDGMSDYGLGGTKKGHEEVLAFMTRARTIFSELRPDPREFIGGGDRVVVLGTHHMRGARSKVSGTVPFVHSWRLSGGLATHFEDTHDTFLVRQIVEGTRSPATELLETHDAHIRVCVTQLIARLGIADRIGAGTRDVAALASATATDPRALYRLLRAATGFGLVTQAEGNGFALTELGAHLRSDHPSSLQGVMVIGGLFGRVFADAEYSLRTGQPTFPKTYGRPLFDYLRDTPEDGAAFAAAMAGFGKTEAQEILARYDFGSTRRIVDVGGGAGTLITAVLTANPGPTGVILERPEVAVAARERITAAGLDGRVTVQVGDFFSDVPVGGDLYVLKWIIHDWPDEQAVAILRRCRSAMAPGSRLLLVERVLPDSDVPHRSKTWDFTMLVVLGGQERTRVEYARLLSSAGLRLERVVPGAESDLLEAVPDGPP